MLIKNLKFSGLVLSEARNEQGILPFRNLKEVILDKMFKRGYVSFLELCLLTDTTLNDRMYEEYKHFFEENWRIINPHANIFAIESENGGVYSLSMLPPSFKDFIENKSNKDFKTYDLLIDNPVFNAIYYDIPINIEDVKTLFNTEFESAALKSLLDLYEKDPTINITLENVDHYSIRKEDSMYRFDLVVKQYDKYGYLTFTKKIKTFRIAVHTLDSAGLDIDDFKLLKCRILSR